MLDTVVPRRRPPEAEALALLMVKVRGGCKNLHSISNYDPCLSQSPSFFFVLSATLNGWLASQLIIFKYLGRSRQVR